MGSKMHHSKAILWHSLSRRYSNNNKNDLKYPRLKIVLFTRSYSRKLKPNCLDIYALDLESQVTSCRRERERLTAK